MEFTLEYKPHQEEAREDLCLVSCGGKLLTACGGDVEQGTRVLPTRKHLQAAGLLAGGPEEHAEEHAEGHAEGYAEGHAEGHAEGLTEEHAEGLTEGQAGGRPTTISVEGVELTPLGRLGGASCWMAGVVDEAVLPALSGGLEWSELRPLLAQWDAAQSQAIAAARELCWWEKRHQFCGCCGGTMRRAENERARVCVACGERTYPVLAPAVIVAITRGDEILLAHNKNFRPGLYSLIAGFVDVGETLEQCVRREALEEVGVQVDELRYVGSQPWPYPASLMLGFFARHTGGSLLVDGVEIEDAAWFKREALPDIPGPGTVARSLIDAWLGV